MEASKRAAENEEKRRIEQQKEEAAAQTTPEPGPEVEGAVTLSFKIPPPLVPDNEETGGESSNAGSNGGGGQRLTRRFLATDPFRAVVYFLKSSDALSGRSWSLYTSHPAMLLGDDQHHRTLEELKLTPRALLLVRDTDA